ncbi:MAG: hypothetical protein IJV71_05720 [Lachnospiraceae bacterium]|nr:hypothetical protein [Lachnospiraceae bacterium]
MAASKVKRENYIAVQGWMLSELGLKGNELLIYACIYGFSQTENQWFTGSHQYLAEWTNSTRRGVIKCLKTLINKGLIIKKENCINGVKFCEYRATELPTYEQSSQGVVNKVHRGSEQSSQGGSEQSSHNNIDIYNLDNNLIDSLSDSEHIAKLYHSICVSYPRLRVMTEQRKREIKARLKEHTLDDFKELFIKAEASSFLKAKKFGFDWLIRADNMAKALEGAYDDRPQTVSKRIEPVPKWASKEQQDYDFESLEAKLVCNSPELQQRAEALKQSLASKE